MASSSRTASDAVFALLDSHPIVEAQLRPPHSTFSTSSNNGMTISPCVMSRIVQRRGKLARAWGEPLQQEDSPTTSEQIVPPEREPAIPVRVIPSAQILWALFPAVLMTVTSIVALTTVVLDAPFIETGIIFINFGLVWILPPAIAILPVWLVTVFRVPRRFIAYLTVYAVIAALFACFEASSCWYGVFANRTMGILTYVILIITTTLCAVMSLVLVGAVIAVGLAMDEAQRFVEEYPHWTVARAPVLQPVDDVEGDDRNLAMATMAGRF